MNRRTELVMIGARASKTELTFESHYQAIKSAVATQYEVIDLHLPLYGVDVVLSHQQESLYRRD